jgi:tRNA 2-selenouridine synthase
MTANSLEINDFLNQSKGELIVDVRAPIEFFKGHIVNAINVPLFDNSERAEVGTLFKQHGKDTAVTRGLEIVSPKMVTFVTQVKELSKNKKVFVYCFRGGMRSNSFAWLMNTSGLNACILNGGYKSYRNHVLDYFELQKKIILLGGGTGSAKTEVLKELDALNYPIVDLEKLAHHKGSAFGAINEERQNPQQVFENNLFQAYTEKESTQAILLEDESQTIGYNKIPIALWRQMKKSPIIKLNIPFELRVQKLLNDYTTTDIAALQDCVVRIASQLGPQNTKLCLNYLTEGNLADVARLSLAYYDKAYNFKYDKNKEQKIIEVDSDTIDAKVNALKVKQIMNELHVN